MRTIDAVRRSAIAMRPDQTIQAAAEIMEVAGVGAIAIVDGETLCGIVTDRDLVRRALAKRLPSDARIDAVMSTPVVTIDADADLRDASALLGSRALRRLPIVQGGRFVGMLTVDDLLITLSADLADLTRPIRAETISPQHDSLVPQR